MRKIYTGLLLSVVGMTAIMVTALPAHAEDTPSSTTTERQKREEELKASIQEKREAIKERVQGKLDEARKKVCQNRSARITAIVHASNEAVQRHDTLFTNTLKRVKEFVTKKNLTVANYEQLLATAEAKQAAVATAFAATKNMPPFDCSGDNPTGKADEIKNNLTAQRNALKEYRQAVKALIEAVKTAAKTAEGSNR